MRVSNKNITQRDRDEIDKFKTYLADVATKNRLTVLAENKDYLMINDDDIRAAWRAKHRSVK